MWNPHGNGSGIVYVQKKCPGVYGATCTEKTVSSHGLALPGLDVFAFHYLSCEK